MSPMINGGNDGIFGNDIIRIIKIEKKNIYIYQVESMSDIMVNAMVKYDGYYLYSFNGFQYLICNKNGFFGN